MIISLSSKDEPSNADFRNYISDNFSIPPNASVALVNCSFTKPSADGFFRVNNANNSFYLKFNAYDISKQIVIPNGDYLLSGLVAALNQVCENLSPIWKILWSANVVDGNDVVVCNWMRKSPESDWDGYYDYGSDILGDYKTKNDAFLPLATGANDLSTRPIQNALTNQEKVDMVGQDHTAVVRTWQFSAHNPTTFTPNTNQNVDRGFECARYNGQVHFTFVAPDVNNVLFCGENDYLPATETYGTYTRIENAAIFKIETDTSTSNIRSYERDANGNWSANAGVEYEPGMTIAAEMRASPSYNGWRPKLITYKVPNFNTWYMPLDFANGYNVNAGWQDYSTGVPTGGGAFTLSYLDYNNWMGVNAETTMDALNWNSQNLYKGAMGSYVGTGSSFRNTKFLVNNAGGANFKNDNTLSNMPNNGGLKFERLVGGVLNYNMTIDLDYNNTYWTGSTPSNPVISDAKTCVSIGFKPRNDTGSIRHTIFGGWSAAAGTYMSALQVDVGNGGAGIINITDEGGDVFSFAQSNWVNASGASFGGFAYEGTYYVGLATKGSAGGNKIDVYIVDKSVGVLVANIYKYTITMNTHSLVSKKYIGGQQDPATNAASTDQRFNGYMWGFNVSQANTNDARVPLTDGMTFFTKFAILANAMIGVVDWFPSDFNVPVRTEPATTGQAAFEVEQANNGRSMGWTFANTSSVSNVSSEQWFSVGNFNFPPIQDVPNSNKFLTSAPAVCFQPDSTATQIGVVNDTSSPSLMKDLQIIDQDKDRDTLPYIDTDSVEPDVVAALVGAGEPTSSINTNDEVMNVNIENLPHTTYNGQTHTQTKSIYQLPQNITKNIEASTEYLDFVVPERVYIPLNNIAEFPVNELHVRITDANNETEENLTATNILIEIK